jgi:hypothetical protein
MMAGNDNIDIVDIENAEIIFEDDLTPNTRALIHNNIIVQMGDVAGAIGGQADVDSSVSSQEELYRLEVETRRRQQEETVPVYRGRLSMSLSDSPSVKKSASESDNRQEEVDAQGLPEGAEIAQQTSSASSRQDPIMLMLETMNANINANINSNMDKMNARMDCLDASMRGMNENMNANMNNMNTTISANIEGIGSRVCAKLEEIQTSIRMTHISMNEKLDTNTGVSVESDVMSDRVNITDNEDSNCVRELCTKTVRELYNERVRVLKQTSMIQANIVNVTGDIANQETQMIDEVLQRTGVYEEILCEVEETCESVAESLFDVECGEKLIDFDEVIGGMNLEATDACNEDVRVIGDNYGDICPEVILNLLDVECKEQRNLTSIIRVQYRPVAESQGIVEFENIVVGADYVYWNAIAQKIDRLDKVVKANNRPIIDVDKIIGGDVNVKTEICIRSACGQTNMLLRLEQGNIECIEMIRDRQYCERINFLGLKLYHPDYGKVVIEQAGSVNICKC